MRVYTLLGTYFTQDILLVQPARNCITCIKYTYTCVKEPLVFINKKSNVGFLIYLPTDTDQWFRATRSPGLNQESS